MRDSKDHYFTILLCLTGALALNTFYFSHIVLRAPRFVSLVVPPVLLGLAMSWICRETRRVIPIILAINVLAAMMISISLLTPVLFGIIADPSYRNWFTFFSMYKVFGNTLFTSFHMFAGGLGGIFIWER